METDMISLLLRDWHRRPVLLCAFPAAVLGASEAMAADFDDRGLALRTARKNIPGIEMFRGLAARIMPTLVAART